VLAPFFHLPGLIVQEQKMVCVELRPFLIGNTIVTWLCSVIA
jgi:hypothetical protein